LACQLAWLPALASAAAQDDGPDVNGTVVPNHYIVVLEDSVDDPGSVARAQTDAHGGRVGFVYRYALKGYSAVLGKGAVEALRNDPRVKYVTPDSIGEGGAQSTPTGVKRVFAPNNKNLAINEESDVWIDADVAVIDSGVDFSHPDLNPTYSMDCVPPKEEPAVKKCVKGNGTDPLGHGTHVAGTVGAIDNNFGVVGVAPGVRLASARVINAKNEVFQSWFAAGIDWVTSKSAFFEVANASLWCEKCNWTVAEEAIEGAVEAGVVFVTIAGNNGELEAKEISPARSPDAITVGAIADYDGLAGGLSKTPPCDLTHYEKLWEAEKDDTWANLSSWGEVVDIVAPGVCINSTLPGEAYGYDTGTSMAAPHVAGAAAILAAAANPENREDVEEIGETLEETGNLGWTAEHEPKQPLLDLSDEEVFDAMGLPTVQLCTAHAGLTCGTEDAATSIHQVLATGTVGELLATIDVLCLGVLAEATALGLSSIQTIHSTAMSFTGCGTGSAHNNCTVSIPEEQQPAFDLLKTGLDEGVLATTGGQVRFVCSNLGLDCLYDVEGTEFAVGGGHLTAEETEVTELGGKFLCPDEGLLDGLLETLTNAYVLG
jgi:subtilisin family serine protease